MSDFKNAEPWVTIFPPSARLPFSSDKLRKVIEELDVEHAPRYKASGGRTWCNVFASDVLTAMGLSPSHWVDKLGRPLAGPTRGGVELNANGMSRWFEGHGSNYGWVSVGREEAMEAAARGHVAVVTYFNESGGSGHIAILLPEGTIAQAGKLNFVGRTIREGFGNLPVRFWVNVHGPHATHRMMTGEQTEGE